MLDNIPVEVRHTAPGIAGSLLALFFLRRPPFVMAGIFIGGCLLSFFGTHYVSEMLNMEKAAGLVGFLLGMFGMVLVGKLYDTIEAVNPAELWTAIKDFVRKRLGVD